MYLLKRLKVSIANKIHINKRQKVKTMIKEVDMCTHLEDMKRMIFSKLG